MKLKTVLGLSTIGVSLILAYLLYFAGRNLGSYPVFEQSVLGLINLFGLVVLIFLVIFYQGGESSQSRNEFSLKGWLLGAGFVLIAFLGMSLYFDPHGLYSASSFLTINPNARNLKLEFYDRVETPELIVFGSSRAFPVSPREIQDTLGYSAFNLSVEGGTITDYRFLLDHVLSKSANNDPKVLLIEMDTDDFRNLNRDVLLFSPPALMRFMPLVYFSDALTQKVLDGLSIKTLIDSVYLVALSSAAQRGQAYTFESDGLGTRAPLTSDQYVRLVARDIETRKNWGKCSRLSPESQLFFEQILEISRDNNIAVIIYFSPVNKPFYDAVFAQNNQFDRCQRLLETYFAGLATRYPNFFHKNLIYYPPVSDLEETGYHDGVHLKPDAARLLVDALTPMIKAAYAWSISQ